MMNLFSLLAILTASFLALNLIHKLNPVTGF